MDGPGRWTSPTARARTIGVLYLLTVVLGGFAQGVIAERFVVAGDAAATAAGIVSGEPMFRLGFAVYLVEMACQITMTVLFYDLLAPAGRRIALVATALGLTGCVFFGLNALLTGWLVLRSTFLPRALGALSMLGGLAWLSYVWPPLGDRLAPVTLAIAIPGALALIAWLLAFGVDDLRWQGRACAAGSVVS